MKIITSLVFSLVLATGLAAEVTGYSVLKVCQEDLVIHTTDGADAGHIGYLVLDSDGQRVVSVMVTGGVLAERVVALPSSSFRYGASREVTLESIDREYLLKAPVIQRERFSTTMRLEPTVIEQSQTYFHVSGERRDVRTNSVRDQRDTTTRTDTRTLDETRNTNTTTRDANAITRDTNTTTRDHKQGKQTESATPSNRTTDPAHTDPKKHTPEDDKKATDHATQPDKGRTPGDATPDKNGSRAHDGKADHKGAHDDSALPEGKAATDTTSTQPETKKHNPAADDKKPADHPAQPGETKAHENKPAKDADGKNAVGNEKAAKPSTREAGDQPAGEKKGATERATHPEAGKEKGAKDKAKGPDDDDKIKKPGGRIPEPQL